MSTIEPNIAEVITAAAAAFGVTADDLAGPSKAAPLVTYRQVTIAACRALTPCSHVVIGKAFGRDHSTIEHACRVVARQERPADLYRQLMDRLATEEVGRCLRP